MSDKSIRDALAAFAYSVANSASEFKCRCDDEGTCWPHEEADIFIDESIAPQIEGILRKLFKTTDGAGWDQTYLPQTWYDIYTKAIISLLRTGVTND